jgi:hypothetical protein
MIPTHETEVLLEILKGNQPVILLKETDIDWLIKVAGRHKVRYSLLLFAQQHTDIFNPEQIVKLENLCRKAALHALVQLNELTCVAERLNKENIGFVCVKGPQLSRMIYGREALKESVDLDIMLTSENDLLPAGNILKQLGYNRNSLDPYTGNFKRNMFLTAKREVQFVNDSDKSIIDLHFRPGSGACFTKGRYRGFLTDIRIIDLEGTPVPVLSDEAYLLYLCYHAALHRFSRLAWLMDIRAFLKVKEKEINFELVFRLADHIKIKRCLCLAIFLIKEYFGEETGKYYCRHSWRMKWLVSMCRKMVFRRADYAVSISGRLGKLIYSMLLLKGLPAKIDWIAAIGMRQIIKLI